MSTFAKILVGLIGVIAIWLTVAIIFAGDPSPTSPPAAEPAPAPEPAAANITLVADKSFCLALPNAKIGFYVTLRNNDQVDGEINAIPWRRYSDNEVNDSIIDTMTFPVPAGSVRKFRNEFGYNAEAHEVIECGLIMEGDTEPTMISVE
jgi:hypothetical protein